MEVAGVVLGALPILYGAARVYKESIQSGKRFFWKRKYVEKLVNSLYFHKGALTEVVRHLLLSSGCDYVFDFEDDPSNLLQNRDVQKKLHEYLGSEAETALIIKLEEGRNAIRKIAKSIAGLVPGLEGPTDDLKTIIEANRQQRERQIDLIPRVKLMLGADDMKTAIQELETTMNSLCHFIKIVCDNRRVTTEKPSKNTNKLAQGIRRMQKLANNLHVAIEKSWKSGCHKDHTARLFLDDRLDAASTLSTNASRKKADAEIGFGLIFEGKHDQQMLWYEAMVKVIEDIEEPQPLVGVPQNSPAFRMNVVAPPNVSTKPIVTDVDDICAAIEDARCHKNYFSFVLSVKQIGSMPSDQNLAPVYLHGDEIRLSSLLSATSIYPIPLDLRMLLALRLSSNLLQLYRTRWLQMAWSKNEIYFPITNAKKVPDFSRPFVSMPFEEACTESQDDVELKTAIFRAWYTASRNLAWQIV